MPSEIKGLKQIEEENTKLKKLVADLSLGKEMLQDVDPIALAEPSENVDFTAISLSLELPQQHQTLERFPISLHRSQHGRSNCGIRPA